MASSLFQSESGAANVYNMPSGAPFLRLLAQGLTDSLGERLPDALILLPTRRAVRELGEAFVHIAASDPKSARRAALLPMMRPLADVDPEEPPFEPGKLAHSVTPAISAVQRRFELSNLVLAKEAKLKGRAPDPAGALALTDPLLNLLDDAAMEELDFSKLDKLSAIAELSAKHYEQASVFYKIVQTYWPAHLKEKKLMDPMQRRVALLRALAQQWENSPPAHPVIIAGSTGTLGATANLMRVVSRQKNGLIVLPGLDVNVDDEAVWNTIEDSHPQASLKRLLGVIEIERKDVQLWPGRPDTFETRSRRRLISEALIPASATADWLERVRQIRGVATGGDPVSAGLEGLSLIETRNDDEEASVIALAMRGVLETPHRTAALVTPDPALGRRVRAKLSRWDVEVDVSAGEPLEETSAGAFLSLIMTLAQNPWDPIALAALFKHPLTGLGARPRAVRSRWQKLERAGFRGTAPKDEAALRARLNSDQFEAEIADLLNLQDQLKPLRDMSETDISVTDFAQTHCQIAQSLAATSVQTDSDDGAQRLWSGEDGEAAAGLMRDLLEHGDILGTVNGQSYTRLIASMMRGRVVRPRFGTHPRLQILGPLEARMLSADVIILGGLNEGVWPSAPAIDPLLSYAMRQEIGLSSPERRFGLSAHDFAQLAAHKNVMMTRSKKSDNGPAVASRWIWRLKTLLRGALGSEDAVNMALTPKDNYLGWARALDHVPADKVEPAKAPAPRPPLDMRWPEHKGAKGRQLSVTRIETWVRDPYALYARQILGLKPLDPLGQAIGPREYGIAVHDALESFSRRYPEGIADGAASWLTEKLESSLIEAGYPREALASERIRLSRMATWFTQWETERRAHNIRPAGVEVTGTITLSPPGGKPFTLTGKADRIDKGPDGYEIIDYKTGQPPSKAQVQSGFSPQLSLEGAILEVSGFHSETQSVAQGPPSDLVYVCVQGRKNPSFERRIAGKIGKETYSAQDLSGQAYEGLMDLIALFDNPDTAYASQPRAKNVNPYGDYDHLARRAEWASAGDDDGTSDGGGS